MKNQGCKRDLFLRDRGETFPIFPESETIPIPRPSISASRRHQDRDLPFRDRDVQTAVTTLCKTLWLQSSNCYKLSCISVIYCPTNSSLAATLSLKRLRHFIKSCLQFLPSGRQRYLDDTEGYSLNYVVYREPVTGPRSLGIVHR